MAQDVEKGHGRPQSLIDDRNKLNALTGKEWIQYSKSYWYQQGLGSTHKHTKIEKEHPAPFSYQDIMKLIKLFTKPGMDIFDPFCGVSSSLKAAALCNRNATGIEISKKWVDLGKQRLQKEVPASKRKKVKLKIIKGDCIKKMEDMSKNSYDFIVTSPPYWCILNKNPDHKTKDERINKGLAKKYSKSPADIGNISDYDTFLKKLGKAAKGCYKILKKDKYLALIVGDFYHKSTFYPYHVHAQEVFKNRGFKLRGIYILVQNNKRLFPYGYPFAPIQNIHHQYILIFQKKKKDKNNKKKK